MNQQAYLLAKWAATNHFTGFCNLDFIPRDIVTCDDHV